MVWVFHASWQSHGTSLRVHQLPRIVVNRLFSLSLPRCLSLPLLRHGEETQPGDHVRVCVARQGWRAPEERSFLGRKLVPYAFVHYIGASVLYTRLWPGTLSVPERRAIEAQGDELAGRSVVESRPRGRVVRDGLGVSFRVGAAQPPLASFLVVSFYRYTPLLTSNSTSVHPSFSFVLSVSLGFSRFLCQVPYSLPFSRVLSLSLSVQLAGARGSDPESSTALPRMAPLTAPLLHPRTSSRVPSLCVVH